MSRVLAEVPIDPPQPAPPVVLLVACSGLASVLEPVECVPRAFESVTAALAAAWPSQPRVCILGPALADAEVGRRVRRLRHALPLTDVLLWHPDPEPAAVRAALRARALDVVLDRSPQAVAVALRRALDGQKLLPRVLENEERDGESWRFGGLLSRSQRMWDLFDMCARTASTRAPVLILGETGTGKELVARAIHARSGRSGPFVALNCGAVPETLIDSELFGHVEGAFTGSVGSKEGLFRYADRGTLFLDEIGTIAPSAQVRLLRALQESKVRPVGGHEEIPVDIRVIAATSAPLTEAVDDDTFREDLLYRIDVIRLIIPPLRERPEDIVFLFGHFSLKLAEHYRVRPLRVTDGFLDAMLSYEWPGNVRELENFAERLLLTHHTDEPVAASQFWRLMQHFHGRSDEEGDGGLPGRLPSDLHGALVDLHRPLREVISDTVEGVERAYLRQILRVCEGRVQRTAERAGISRRTLLRRLTAYGIDKRDYRPGGRHAGSDTDPQRH